ncbi:hypothetical protein Fmac_029741 [Flemingia macrophylla]|uniref:Uncharacterized protein n=1 Tax=Flemingia macrophylla TaxID=520843 RepID=A0ABD1LB61_9FABA
MEHADRKIKIAWKIVKISPPVCFSLGNIRHNLIGVYLVTFVILSFLASHVKEQCTSDFLITRDAVIIVR